MNFIYELKLLHKRIRSNQKMSFLQKINFLLTNDNSSKHLLDLSMGQALLQTIYYLIQFLHYPTRQEMLQSPFKRLNLYFTDEGTEAPSLVELGFTVMESHSMIHLQYNTVMTTIPGYHHPSLSQHFYFFLAQHFYNSNSRTPYKNRCHKTAGFFPLIFFGLYVIHQI